MFPDKKQITGASKVVGLWLMIAIFLSGGCARKKEKIDDPFSVTVLLNPQKILIGDEMECTIEIKHPENFRPQLPNLKREKEIVVLNRYWRREAVETTNLLTRGFYKLTSFRVGEFLLATNPVEFASEKGKTMEVEFPDIGFSVLSSLTNTTDRLEENDELVKIPTSTSPWWWALGLFVLCLIIFILFRLKIKMKEPPPPPPPPPHMIARKALRKLKSKGFIESGEVETFYVELSGIVRTYIEGRFHLSAPEMTTEEFIRETAHSNVLSSAHRLLTQSFLEQSDLVKFAKHHPTLENMRNAFEAAEKLVKETEPKEEME